MYEMKYWKTGIAVVALAVSSLTSACSLMDQAEEEDKGHGHVVARLTQVNDCDELLQNIQDDVIAKIDAAALNMRDYETNYQYNVDRTSTSGEILIGIAPPSQPMTGWGEDDSDGDFATNTANATEAPSGIEPVMVPQAAGSMEMDEESVSVPVDAKALSPTSYSDTNLQVAEVDEPDIVKTDGDYLYILHGRELFLLKAWEPSSTDVRSHLKMEGSPREMFVHKDKAVVYSTIYDEDGSLSGIEEGESNDVYIDYYGQEFTKITAIDIEDRDNPEVSAEFYIKGSYLSARRHDNIVRTVIQGGFVEPNFSANIEYFDIWGKKLPKSEIDEQIKFWRSNMIEQVRSTKLENWLPTEYRRRDGELEPLEPRCDSYYTPSPGLTQFGMTNIVALDISQDKINIDDGGAVILGKAEEVYSSSKVMVLAHNDISWFERGLNLEQTALHRFDLASDNTTRYVASGFVQGHIKDQYSIDEHEGYLRVATMLWDFRGRFLDADEPVDAEEDEDSESTSIDEPPQIPDNRVYTLKVVEGELQQQGKTKPLGHPGEEIRSVRFVGDYGYVVTFEQTDPLIVVDLSSPEEEELEILGQLEIAGFSQYMHPIDKDHLLTIGRNADLNGRDLGLMLRIFNVSDPTSPKELHSYPYQIPGESTAATEYKAFNYYGDRGLLALPFIRWGSPFLSSLDIFRVSVDNGFQQLGSIDHTRLLTNECSNEYAQVFYDSYFIEVSCGRPSPEVRRGVFITGEVEGQKSDFIYSISYGGVLVHDLADLTESVAEVVLPSIDPYEWDGNPRVGMPDIWIEDTVVGTPMTDNTMVDAPPPDVPDMEPEIDMDGGSSIDPECGNGITDGDEQCDGPDLNGMSCLEIAGTEGELVCSTDCTFDLSSCE